MILLIKPYFGKAAYAKTNEGVLVGFGLKEHFSLIEAIETGISCGVAKWADLSQVLKDAELLKELRMVGIVALSNQLQELAFGQIRQINFRSLFNSMLATFVGGKIGIREDLSPMEQSIVTDVIEVSTSSLIMGYSPSAEMIAAQLLGTVVGNELGDIANKKIKELKAATQSSVDETKSYAAQVKAASKASSSNSTLQPKAESKASRASAAANPSAMTSRTSIVDPAEANLYRLLGLSSSTNSLEDFIAEASGICTNHQVYNAAGDEKPPTVSSSSTLNRMGKLGIGIGYFGMGVIEGGVSVGWDVLKGLANLTLHPFSTVANTATGIFHGAEFLAQNAGPFLHDAMVLNDSISPLVAAPLRTLAASAGLPLTSPIGRESNPEVIAARARMDQRLAPITRADTNTRMEMMGKLVVGLGVGGAVAKGVSKLGLFARGMEMERAAVKPLDWSRPGKNVANAAEHVIQSHGNLRLDKLVQGVFYSNDPIKVTEKAWQYAKSNGIKPITIGERDHYVIPISNVGFEGGIEGQLQTDNHITIVTESGTNKVITAFPSGATLRFPKDYQFLLLREEVNYDLSLH